MEGFKPRCTFGQSVNFGLLLRNIDGVLERTQNRKSGAKHVALYASVTTFQMEGNNPDFCEPYILACGHCGSPRASPHALASSQAARRRRLSQCLSAWNSGLHSSDCRASSSEAVLCVRSFGRPQWLAI